MITFDNNFTQFIYFAKKNVISNLLKKTDKNIFSETHIRYLCSSWLTILTFYDKFPGIKWHTRRKMLTPTFHFKILENFIPIFNRNAKLLTKNFTSSKNTAVEVDSYVSLCTLDIICGEFNSSSSIHRRLCNFLSESFW